MNRTYKVIWNRVKSCYVVVSELAKNHTKNCHGSKALVVAGIGLSILLGGAYTVSAADNTAGSGKGVAIGTGSNAQKDGVVAIGKNAHTNYAGGSGYANINGDVVIGENATTHSYYDQSGSVAIGKNSYVENTVGQQDKLFAFNQTSFNSWGLGSLPQQPDKVVTGVAVGDNTYVRSGGTMIGSHNYRGKMGDITVNTDTYKEKRKASLGIYSTTIGANSFTNGTVATTSGALNVISSDYDGTDVSKATKNFGATVNGSLNSIESATSNNNVSGLANAVVGTANRAFNSNGSLIFGAGNEITNSIAAVDTTSITGSPFSGPGSVTEMAGNLRKLVKNSESGGSTLAIGGGNKADWTQKTSIIGANNTTKGTSGNVAKLNFVSGFKNTVTNASNNIVMGNDHTVTADNTVAIGGLSSADTRSVANTTSVGYDSKASVADGVALGYKSNATVDKGAVGYDAAVKSSSSKTDSTWKATTGAVSVGDGTTVTRQITSVAAGTNDTDAVNVAQLKAASTEVVGTGSITVTQTQDSADGHAIYTITGNSGTGGTTYTAGDNITINGDVISAKDTRNTVTAGDNTTVEETKNSDGSSTYKVNAKANGKIENGNTGIVTGGTVYNETRVANNGSYVKTDNTAGKNISVLDAQVKTNADNINRLDNRVDNMGNSINKLGNRLDKVGAGAAALAALHPLDFDENNKLTFAAGLGNYRNQNAAAIGAFYRPDDWTMLSVGGSVGNGENMVNLGVSFALDRKNGAKSLNRAQSSQKIAELENKIQIQNETMKKMQEQMAVMQETINQLKK